MATVENSIRCYKYFYFALTPADFSGGFPGPKLRNGAMWPLQGECSRRLELTCSIYAGTGSLQGAEALASEGHVLLVEG